MSDTNDVKERILNRLYKHVGICSFCRRRCGHTNKHLPDTLKTRDVLRAINLDEHFEKVSNP